MFFDSSKEELTPFQIKSSKESIRDVPVSFTHPAVESLCNPPHEAKLYGYDFGKKRLTDTIDKKREFRVSEAVALMARTEGDEIIPVCRAFLKRLTNFTNSDLEKPTKRLFFTSVEQNGPIDPQEMKYAVLVLLGLSESNALNQLKFYDKNVKDKLVFSPDFAETIRNVERTRSLYPLEHLGEFPTLETPVNKIKEALKNSGASMTVEAVFKENKVPPLVDWERENNKPELPLDIALLVLVKALNGKYREYDTVLAMGDENPFSQEVMSLVEQKRKETQKPTTQSTEKTG